MKCGAKKLTNILEKHEQQVIYDLPHINLESHKDGDYTLRK
jgi:hypothetical protein